MNIKKIQYDYGGNFPDKGKSRKIKEEGKGLAFYTTTKS
jgi:hypothetical protein